MFDGNTFLPVTGMPIRKTACMSRLFALAEPVPFTVPILNAKSLMLGPLPPYPSDMLRHLTAKWARRHRHRTNVSARRSTGIRQEQLELPHVPRGRWAALGAETAV